MSGLLTFAVILAVIASGIVLGLTPTTDDRVSIRLIGWTWLWCALAFALTDAAIRWEWVS